MTAAEFYAQEQVEGRAVLEWQQLECQGAKEPKLWLCKVLDTLVVCHWWWESFCEAVPPTMLIEDVPGLYTYWWTYVHPIEVAEEKARKAAEKAARLAAQQEAAA